MGDDVLSYRFKLKVENDELAAVLAASSSSDPRGLVVMLHGGPGGQKDGPENLYSDLADVLARAGIASIRFDFRGVGESSGKYRDMTIRRQVSEYEAVWQFARSLGFSRIGAVGESYGATSLLLSGVADPDVVCLLWPALYFLDVTFAPFVTDEKMEEARRNGFTLEDGVEVGLSFLEEVFEIDNAEEGIRRLTVPTLLIHGTDDREVPVSQSQRAYELLHDPKKFVPVEGGDHCLVRPAEREIVYTETSDWLSTYL